jgi:pimeloyl-ACP methyl ester carboxylesterase
MLKPPPQRGDIIASRLSAPTTNNLAHHRTGAGEPLVLLHGVGESAVGWQPIHQALSDHYDVIAMDLPGFGHSPRSPRGLRPPRRPWRMPLKASWTGSALPSSTSPGTPSAPESPSSSPPGAAPIRSSPSPPTDWAPHWNESTRRQPC